MNEKEVLKESQKWLDIISSNNITDEMKRQIINETVENFSFYYNRGYLDYRKSVVEMREEPALEWDGQGSVFCDILGRRFIDCLGGYGTDIWIQRYVATGNQYRHDDRDLSDGIYYPKYPEPRHPGIATQVR